MARTKKVEKRKPEVLVCRNAKRSSANPLSMPDYPIDVPHCDPFVNLVRETFQHRPETYWAFIRLMQDYNKVYPRLTTERIFFDVHLLFKEHKELLKGFNNFLPEHEKACLGPAPWDCDDCIALIAKVERRLSLKQNGWDSFIQVLTKRVEGIYDRADTFLEICKLVEDDRELILEFWKHGPPITKDDRLT